MVCIDTVTCRSANFQLLSRRIHSAMLRCANSEVSNPVAAQSDSGAFIAHQLHPPLFCGLAKSEIDLVLAAAATRKCAKGAILSIEGEPANQFFMLLSGRARYFTLTED